MSLKSAIHVIYSKNRKILGYNLSKDLSGLLWRLNDWHLSKSKVLLNLKLNY